MLDADRYAQLRADMVTHQLVGRGITDPGVLQAMGTVPREAFVSPEIAESAYADSALPIQSGQTISQPFTVAFMCQAAELTGVENVLEIGTGTGYSAAVLSLLARWVHTIERVTELAESAKARLRKLGYTNITCHVGDGALGWPQAAPYDAILVAAAAPRLPPSYEQQLSQGGRIIIPIGDVRREQRMFRYRLKPEGLIAEPLGTFAFVPLVTDMPQQQFTGDGNDG